ncbi:AAA family ATPase [Actinomadura sp. ATCC 39365]
MREPERLRLLAAARGGEPQERANPIRPCSECGDMDCACWPTDVPEGIEDRVQALLDELLDTAALDDIPSLEPLVADVLFLDTVTRLHGPSGTFKSFLTLSLAGAVGGGVPWYGRAVRQGNVVYIVAEGIKGMRKRVRAWEQHHDRRMAGVHFLPRPVQVKSAEWDILVEACRRMQAVLIIVDTQARVTVGVNENDNTEMGVILDLLERMRAVTGACVLVVHHSGHENAERGRGASAMKGGMQTELGVSRRGKGLANTRVTLDMGKQKDDEEGAVETFRLKQVPLSGEFKDDGRPVTSIVLVPADSGVDVGPEEGTVEWLVMKLDAANVPADWGQRRTIQACAELEIRARKEKIEEAVRIRKNRTNDVPPTSGGHVGTLRTPDVGGTFDVAPGQMSPGATGGHRGTATPTYVPPSPPLRAGGHRMPGDEKDGPTTLCDVCLKTMTAKPGMTRHVGCQKEMRSP